MQRRLPPQAPNSGPARGPLARRPGPPQQQMPVGPNGQPYMQVQLPAGTPMPPSFETLQQYHPQLAQQLQGSTFTASDGSMQRFGPGSAGPYQSPGMPMAAMPQMPPGMQGMPPGMAPGMMPGMPPGMPQGAMHAMPHPMHAPPGMQAMPGMPPMPGPGMAGGYMPPVPPGYGPHGGQQFAQPGFGMAYPPSGPAQGGYGPAVPRAPSYASAMRGPLHSPQGGFQPPGPQSIYNQEFAQGYGQAPPPQAAPMPEPFSGSRGPYPF